MFAYRKDCYDFMIASALQKKKKNSNFFHAFQSFTLEDFVNENENLVFSPLVIYRFFSPFWKAKYVRVY